MSDVTASKKVEEPENPNATAAAAFGSQLDEITDALGILYIKNNASGRHKFLDKWPDIAQYIFGETLIKYDHEGTKDRAHRAELEEEADQRRVLLKDTIREMVDKSVDAGVLKFDYVGQVIDQFGPDLSPYLYSEAVIERVRPGLLAKRKTEKEADDQAASDSSDQADEDIRIKERASHNPQESLYDDQKLSAEESDILSNTDDQYDAVKPIELSESIETPREGIKEDVNLPGDEQARAEQEEKQKLDDQKEEAKTQATDSKPPMPSEMSELDNIRPIETQTLVDSSEPKADKSEDAVAAEGGNPAPELPKTSEASNPAPELPKAPEVSNPAPEIPKATEASNPAPDLQKEVAVQEDKPNEDIVAPEAVTPPVADVDVQPLNVTPELESVKPIETPLQPETPVVPKDESKDAAPAPAAASASASEEKGAAPSVFHRKLAEKPKKPKGYYMDIFNGLAKETKQETS